MPPTRLLVIADAKLLPALAGGLREGGRFDVAPLDFGDRDGALSASRTVDAAAIFYGAASTPLPAVLQALAPQLRNRGGRLVAVLQRNQAPMRDACFRSGASDVLFMPVPKDEFIARLADCISLQFDAGPSVRAPLTLSTRTASSKIEQGAISAAGVEVIEQLPLKPGETVRVAWDSLQQWGLVVRGGPSTQVRFAGLAAEDEAKIRAWVDSAMQAAPWDSPLTPASPLAAAEVDDATPEASPLAAETAAPDLDASEPTNEIAAALTPPAAQAPPPAVASSPAAAAETPVAVSRAEPARTPPPGIRAAPVSGPPPGFADRKPVRTPVRRDPPAIDAMSTPGAAPAVGGHVPTASSPAPAAPSAGVAPAPSRTPAPRRAAAAPAPASVTPDALFDESSAGPTEENENLPVWPTPAAPELYKELLMRLLRDQAPPSRLSPAIVASARKITSIMSAAERTALADAGAESAIPDALSARIALDSSTVEGAKLAVRVRTAAVDTGAVAALTSAADEAAARLQKSANVAIGKGEVEELQLITSVSASLSRDLLNFREMSERLRGVSNGPRLGVGSLDPDVVLPGHQSRARPLASAHPGQVKAELRDFRALDTRRSLFKPVLAGALLATAIAAGVHAFYLSGPRHAELSVAAAGEGVSHIDMSGDAALVTVTPEWVAHSEARIPRLVGVLRANRVRKVALALPSGGTVGLLDVDSGKIYGGPMKTAVDGSGAEVAPSAAELAPAPAQDAGAAPAAAATAAVAPISVEAASAARVPPPPAAPPAQKQPATAGTAQAGANTSR